MDAVPLHVTRLSAPERQQLASTHPELRSEDAVLIVSGPRCLVSVVEQFARLQKTARTARRNAEA
jgi:hypothetical protein